MKVCYLVMQVSDVVLLFVGKALTRSVNRSVLHDFSQNVLMQIN